MRDRLIHAVVSIDNVSVRDGNLVVSRLLGEIPSSESELESLRKTLRDNPLLLNQVISADQTATAIFVPLEPGANGKQIADEIRKLLPGGSGGTQYFLAGDPVARDTFGAEMFRQMGLFSPIAGMVMCLALWLMFRSAALVLANMVVAMISIIWSMGLFIGLGFPVHIMSSMGPVFLMAIATDSVHIFNEFHFRYDEVGDKRQAAVSCPFHAFPGVGH